MSAGGKIAWAALLIIFISVSVFGWRLSTVYRGFVASTDSGEPTYSETVREDFGRQITQNLKDKVVKIAIVSRAGQAREKLPEGILFTHSAFWVANDTGGYDVWNLYHGEENRLISSLVVDSPADFLRLTQEPDVGILIPTLAAQDRIVTYLKSPKYGAVHQVKYSLISNPLDARFQNCNEFMLDTLAALFWETETTSEIKARLKTDLTPAVIKTSWARRTIGPKVDERLIMDDQDEIIITATRATLSGFLDSQSALAEDYILPLAIKTKPRG